MHVNSEDKEYRIPKKRRKIEKPIPVQNNSSIAGTNNKVMKDLIVKIERMNHPQNHSDSNGQQNSSAEKSEERNESEERQVPELPIAEDEPATEISSTCPQGLKKEGSQEDMVTSSSQETRLISVLIQTDPVQQDVSPTKVTIFLIFFFLAKNFFFYLKKQVFSL